MNKKNSLIIGAALGIFFVLLIFNRMLSRQNQPGPVEETSKQKLFSAEKPTEEELAKREEKNVARAIALRGTYIKDIQLCSQLNSDGSPLAVANHFYPDTPAIFLTVRVEGAKNPVLIKTNWLCYEIETPLDIDYDQPIQGTGHRVFVLTKPDNGWPIGNYAVNISEGNIFVVRKLFTVKSRP